MQYQPNQKKKIQHVSLSTPGEMQRLLMRYGGIFPNNIKEYAEKYLKKNKAQKNFAR